MLIRDSIAPASINPVDSARSHFMGQAGLQSYDLWRDVEAPRELHQQMNYLVSRLGRSSDLVKQVAQQIENQEKALHYVEASESTEIVSAIDFSVSDVVVDAYDGSIRPVMRHARMTTGVIEPSDIKCTVLFRDDRLIVIKKQDNLFSVAPLRILSDQANYCGFYISGDRSKSGVRLDLSEGMATIEVDFVDSLILIWGFQFTRATYPRLAVLQTRALNEKLRVPKGISVTGQQRWEFSTDGTSWKPGLDIADSGGHPYIHAIGWEDESLQILVEDEEFSTLINSGINIPINGKVEVPHWIIPETLVAYRDLNHWVINEVTLTGSMFKVREGDTHATIEVNGAVFEDARTTRRSNDKELLANDVNFQRLDSAAHELEASIRAMEVSLQTAMTVTGSPFDDDGETPTEERAREYREMAASYSMIVIDGFSDTVHWPWYRFQIGKTYGHPIWEKMSKSPWFQADIELALERGSTTYSLPITPFRKLGWWRSQEDWRGISTDGRKTLYKLLMGWLLQNATRIENSVRAADQLLERFVTDSDNAIIEYRRIQRKKTLQQDYEERMDEIRSIENIQVPFPVTSSLFDDMLLLPPSEIVDMIAEVRSLLGNVGHDLKSNASIQDLIQLKNGQRLLDEGRNDAFLKATEELLTHFYSLGGLINSWSAFSAVGQSRGRVSTNVYCQRREEMQIAIPVSYMDSDSQSLYWSWDNLRGVSSLDAISPTNTLVSGSVEYHVFLVNMRAGRNVIFFDSPSLVAQFEVAEIDVKVVSGDNLYDISVDKPGVIVSPHGPARAVDYDVYKHFVDESRRYDVAGLKNHYNHDDNAWQTEIWLDPPDGFPNPKAAVFLEYKYRDDTPAQITATDEDFYLRTTLVSTPDKPTVIDSLQVDYIL